MRSKNIGIEAISIALVGAPSEEKGPSIKPVDSDATLRTKPDIKKLPSMLLEKPLPPTPMPSRSLLMQCVSVPDLVQVESLGSVQILTHELIQEPASFVQESMDNHTYIEKSKALEPLSEREGLPIAIQPPNLETIYEQSIPSGEKKESTGLPSSYMNSVINMISPSTPPRKHKKASLSITVPPETTFSLTSPSHSSRPPSPTRAHHQASYSIPHSSVTPSLRKFSLSIPSVFKRHKRSGTSGSVPETDDSDTGSLYGNRSFDAETSSMEESTSGIFAAFSRWTLTRGSEEDSRCSSPDKRQSSLDDSLSDYMVHTPTPDDYFVKSMESVTHNFDVPTPLVHSMTMPRISQTPSAGPSPSVLSKSLPDKEGMPGLAMLEESRHHSRSKSVSIELPKQPATMLRPSVQEPKSAESLSKYHHRRHSSHHPIETKSIHRTSKSSKVFTPTGEEQVEGTVNQYDILREIGAGAYGRVVLVRHRETGRYYACKIVSKSRLRKKFRWAAPPSLDASSKSLSRKGAQLDPLDMIKKEIAILKKVSNHPNINQLVEVMDDAKEDSLFMGTFQKTYI
jgi:hypothetical protein